jgi:DNA-binding GntR family transcriptional regulator
MLCDMTTAARDEQQFAKVRAGLLVDEAHRALRESIMRGRFAPGARLPDSMVATEMGISRAPVREALRLLHEEGLVSKEPNRSYVVSEFTENDLMELAALRISLETLSIRALVHNRSSLEQLDQALDDIRVAAERGDQGDIVRSDLQFHTVLVEASGLDRVVGAYRRIRNQSEIALVTGITSGSWPGPSASHEEHRALLVSLREGQESGSPTATIALLERHILGGRAAQLIGSLDPT